jgi:TetR/AcrR family transcriptional regulator, regulator of cefoperazone and chloramphenicol sensitivity
MRKPRTDGQETRQRLLAAASQIFAEKGFWETTNADICKVAGVNTAAVNYHFRSKEELYIEAWKHSFQRSIQQYPPDGGVSPQAPLAERLRGTILSFMRRIADPQAYDHDIIHKEMACPTGLLTNIIEKATEPIRNDMDAIIREMLGRSVTEQQIQFCHMNISALCFGPLLHMRHMKKVENAPIPKELLQGLDIDLFAEHTTRFILFGILGIGDKTEKAPKPGHKNRDHNKAFQRTRR